MNIWEHDVEQRRYIAKFRRTYLVQHKPDMETHRSSLRRLAPRHERMTKYGLDEFRRVQ